MMDDSGGSSGLSRWAWFELGSMDAKRRMHTRQFVRGLFQPRQPAVDANSARIAALEVENAQLRQQLATYQHNYAKLMKWAQDAKRDLDGRTANGN